jgi:hypothetical protein
MLKKKEAAPKRVASFFCDWGTTAVPEQQSGYGKPHPDSIRKRKKGKGKRKIQILKPAFIIIRFIGGFAARNAGAVEFHCKRGCKSNNQKGNQRVIQNGIHGSKVNAGTPPAKTNKCAF